MDDATLIKHLATILGMTLVGGALILGPIGRALARRIAGEHTRTNELDDLHERVQHLEQGENRVSELEERLEFTERVLAKERDAGRLPKPGA
ncbi:MAG: hypothetical protein ABJD11_01705 [Gemmatimonadota bacterium]